MSKNLRVAAILGVTGTGKTVRDAKIDAQRRILNAASEDLNYNPKIVTWRGETVLVYRTFDGWEYSWLQHRDDAEVRLRGTCVVHSDDFRTVLKTAQMAVADAGWRMGEPIDLFPEFLTSPEDRAEITSRREWQLQYKDLHDKGFSDLECRNIIGGFETEASVLAGRVA